jgi:hypothetical protein
VPRRSKLEDLDNLLSISPPPSEGQVQYNYMTPIMKPDLGLPPLEKRTINLKKEKRVSFWGAWEKGETEI